MIGTGLPPIVRVATTCLGGCAIGVIVKPPNRAGAGAGAGSFIVGVRVKLPATTFPGDFGGGAMCTGMKVRVPATIGDALAGGLACAVGAF